MKESYNNSYDFVDDLSKESVRDTLMLLGYIEEDSFKGSKISCPFHGTDKTPSMQVTDNFFKCYSCDAKGDIIKWVELSDGLNFLEAVKHISESLNISLNMGDMSEYTKMKVALAKEWDIYKENLNTIVSEGSKLSEYVKGLLVQYFPQEVGYDKNIDYIVLPFTSKTGTVLGFTKRRVDYVERKDKPKWLHSYINNSLIKYCSNVFNLGRANKHISNSNEAYMVEGPKDVAAMERAGYLNTISISGTANISDSVLSVLGVLKKLNVCMDGDDAGRKAIKTSIIEVSKINANLLKNMNIISIKDGEDPASLDKEELIESVENSKNAISWMVENGTGEDICSMVSNSNSNIVKSDTIVLLNRKLGYTSMESEEWIKSHSVKKHSNKNTTVAKNDMKSRLLATIGECSDINVQPLNMSEEEARKILKLRYKY